MKLQEKQAAPLFSVKSVDGQTVDLYAYRGKKVLLTFQRFAGCPVCNFRFHELESNAAFFSSNNVVVIAVYESSLNVMNEFVGGETFHTILIPNPDLSLYNLYSLERSTAKLIRGIFNGAISKMKKGKKLFRKEIKQDGNSNRVEADFLIDENGKIIIAHYGKFVGDDLSIDAIKKAIN